MDKGVCLDGERALRRYDRHPTANRMFISTTAPTSKLALANLTLRKRFSQVGHLFNCDRIIIYNRFFIVYFIYLHDRL